MDMLANNASLVHKRSQRNASLKEFIRAETILNLGRIESFSQRFGHTSGFPSVTNKKLRLLKLIKLSQNGLSLLQLAEKSSLSLPQVYYHINGDARIGGLQQVGLVKMHNNSIILTKLGETILKRHKKPIGGEQNA